MRIETVFSGSVCHASPGACFDTSGSGRNLPTVFLVVNYILLIVFFDLVPNLLPAAYKHLKNIPMYSLYPIKDAVLSDCISV